MERRLVSLKEQEIYEDKVMEWTDDNFVLNDRQSIPLLFLHNLYFHSKEKHSF